MVSAILHTLNPFPDQGCLLDTDPDFLFLLLVKKIYNYLKNMVRYIFLTFMVLPSSMKAPADQRDIKLLKT